MSAVDKFREALIAHGKTPIPSGDGFKCCCPAHDDNNPSLGFERGNNGGVVVKCHAGCRTEKVAAALGLSMKDLMPASKPNDIRNQPQANEPLGKIVKTYDYCDESGVMLYQAVRYEEPKDFRQRRPNPRRPGDWLMNLNGVLRVPYRLPELLSAPTESLVFVAEGEKDTDNLRALGFVATTNAMGAKSWGTLDRETVAKAFRGRDVVIIPDNDHTKEARIKSITKSLQDVATRIRVLDLPGLPVKGDVSDWLEQGHTAEDLLAEVQKATTPATVVAESTNALALTPDQRANLTDVGNAARFVSDHAECVRYVPTWGWMVYDGRRWVRDAAKRTQELAKQTVAELLRCASASFADLGKQTAANEREEGLIEAQKKIEKARIAWAMKSQDAKRISAMLSLALSDPKIVALVEQFDADPFAFNVLNGTLDLRTGKLREHAKTDHITHLAPVVFDASADAPTWGRFLKSVFDDVELIQWLQRFMGYCLTGDTREQVLAIFFGNGSNGKSVLLEIMLDLMGDYGHKANAEMLLASNSDRHETEKAVLCGKRFVAAAETGEDRRLNEALVKEVTGGDRITARFMRQDHFTFAATFKLALATNHKPGIRGTDNGIWRRILPIPFTKRFWKEGDAPGPEELRADPGLKDKLKKELPGILAWMVRGSCEWHANGLGTCGVVMAATNEYRAAEDRIAEFMLERCILDVSQQVKASELFAVYKAWSEGRNERPLTQTMFGTRMLNIDGITKRRTNRGYMMEGIGIMPLV